MRTKVQAKTPVENLLIQPEYSATSFEEVNGTTVRNNGRFSLRIVRSF